MLRKLIYMGLLSTGLLAWADAPTWNRIDVSSIEQARLSLADGLDKELTISTLNLLSEGVKPGARQHYSLTLMNHSPAAARVLIEFFGAQGQRVNVRSADGTAAAEFVTVSAGAETTVDFLDATATLGWVRATSDQSEGVRLQAQWGIDDTQVIFKSTTPEKLNATFHLAAGTHLSLVNPSDDTDTAIRLTAFDAEGSEACEALVELPPGSQQQGSVAKWLPCSDIRFVGLETTTGKATAAAYVLIGGTLGSAVPMYQNDQGDGGNMPTLMACTPTFSDDVSDIVGAGGRSISFYVRASAGCGWSISAPGDFGISPRSSSGTKRVTVQIPNWPSTGGRQVEFRVGNSRFQVRQNGTACRYIVNPLTLEYTSGGGAKAFFVESNCHWEISSVPYWYSVNEKRGFGNKGAVVSVTSSTRSRWDYLMVADKRLRVNQTR